MMDLHIHPRSATRYTVTAWKETPGLVLGTEQVDRQVMTLSQILRLLTDWPRFYRYIHWHV